MKYHDIVTLFKREVKCDKDFKEFVKAFKISDNTLKKLNYDGYIDYCYKCREFHFKKYDHDPIFKSNISWCENCLLGYSKEKEMEFIRRMLNLKSQYSERGVSINVRKNKRR